MIKPTPVSALIHAATLVTAGVYLMLRVAPLLEYAETTVLTMAFVGALTAVFAATSGLAQTDIKRVIAYSTCSQVGYIFISLGIGHYNLALYHLSNHACFKAMLFIAAGAVIHAFFDQQDIRQFGGISSLIPLIYSTFLIGSLSLMAVPFLTGWYSKDGILEISVGSFTLSGNFVYCIGTLVAGLTAYYSVRLLSLTFISSPRGNYGNYSSAHDAPALVAVPLVVLAVFSVVLGYVSSDIFRGFGTDLLSFSAPTSPALLATVDAEFGAPTAFKLGPFAASLVGGFASYWAYISANGTAFLASIFNGNSANKGNITGNSVNKWIIRVFTFFNAQWHFDALIISGVIIPALRVGYSLSKVMDRGLLEALGPYGLQQRVSAGGDAVANYSTGVLTDYAIFIVLAMLIGVVAFAVPSLTFLSGIVPGSVGANSLSIGMTMAVIINVVSAYFITRNPKIQ